MENSDWWTSPTESEDGKLIMVTGRRDIDIFRKNPKFKIRIEITWPYNGDLSGMPDDVTATLMDDVQTSLLEVFEKDPVAVLTGIYTGNNERNWVFYTLSTHIFGKKINEALAKYDLLPISIYSENDPDWNEYYEMKDISEIAPE